MAHLCPLHVLDASLAGLMNQQQTEVLEYLDEKNRVLKEQLKGRALPLSDDQRRRLAAKGKKFGRRLLLHVASISARGSRSTSAPELNAPLDRDSTGLGR